jgi:hypothetical protein
LLAKGSDPAFNQYYIGTTREVIMGNGLTRDQMKRGDFLRDLASDPQKALRYWKRLKPARTSVVITFMTLTYGHTFALGTSKETG